MGQSVFGAKPLHGQTPLSRSLSRALALYNDLEGVKINRLEIETSKPRFLKQRPSSDYQIKVQINLEVRLEDGLDFFTTRKKG